MYTSINQNGKEKENVAEKWAISDFAQFLLLPFYIALKFSEFIFYSCVVDSATVQLRHTAISVSDLDPLIKE